MPHLFSNATMYSRNDVPKQQRRTHDRPFRAEYLPHPQEGLSPIRSRHSVRPRSPVLAPQEHWQNRGFSEVNPNNSSRAGMFGMRHNQPVHPWASTTPWEMQSRDRGVLTSSSSSDYEEEEGVYQAQGEETRFSRSPVSERRTRVAPQGWEYDAGMYSNDSASESGVHGVRGEKSAYSQSARLETHVRHQNNGFSSDVCPASDRTRGFGMLPNQPHYPRPPTFERDTSSEEDEGYDAEVYSEEGGSGVHSMEEIKSAYPSSPVLDRNMPPQNHRSRSEVLFADRHDSRGFEWQPDRPRYPQSPELTGQVRSRNQDFRAHLLSDEEARLHGYFDVEMIPIEDLEEDDSPHAITPMDIDLPVFEAAHSVRPEHERFRSEAHFYEQAGTSDMRAEQGIFDFSAMRQSLLFIEEAEG